MIEGFRSKKTINDLKRIVEEKGYTAFTTSGVTAIFKQFDYQLEPHHCEPANGYNNTMFIWHKEGSK